MSDDRSLQDLLDHANADAAVRRRAGAAMRRRLAGTDATVAGILVDLSDRDAVVTLEVGTRPLSGLLLDVDRESVTLSSGRMVHLVRLQAIDAIRLTETHHDLQPIDGDRPVASRRSWAAAVRSTIEPDEEIVVVRRGSTDVGTVIAMSAEVLQLRAGTSIASFSLDAVDIVSVSDPGSIRHD